LLRVRENHVESENYLKAKKWGGVRAAQRGRNRTPSSNNSREALTKSMTVVKGGSKKKSRQGKKLGKK